jgi:hypothetical protein
MKENNKPQRQTGKLVTPKSDNPDDPVVNPDSVKPDKPVDPIKPLIDPELEKQTDQPEPAEPTRATVIKMSRPMVTQSFTKSLLIFVVVVVVIVGGGLGLYATFHNTTKSTVSSHTGTSTTAVKSSGTVTNSCGSKTCFATDFQKCTPATENSSSSIAKIKYSIIGPSGSGCGMTFEYTYSPVTAWVNQSMTCNFDNTQPLSNAVALVFNSFAAKQNTYDCTGSLATLLQTQ